MTEDLPKLVRDRIPEIIEGNDETPVTRQLSDSEVVPFLRQKVEEEAREFAESGEAEELADLMEVIDRYLELQGVEREDIQELREQKNDERGAFSRNILLEDVE